MLIAAALLACAESTLPASDVVKIRASREFECSENRVRVRDLGGRAYQVAACGEVQTYVCNKDGADSLDDITCVREGSPLPSEEEEPQPGYVPPPVIVR